MNRHFRDSVYYLKRATEEAKKGVEMEAEPVSERVAAVRERVAVEEEGEVGRVEHAKTVAREAREWVQTEAEQVVGAGRERVESVRGEQAA